jgi:hypothetical protein
MDAMVQRISIELYLNTYPLDPSDPSFFYVKKNGCDGSNG